MAYRYDFLRVYGGWGINSKMEKKVSRAFFDLRGFGSAATIYKNIYALNVVQNLKKIQLYMNILCENIQVSDLLPGY